VPLYEYECAKCGKHFERIEKFSPPHLKKCPACGGRVERLVSAPAIQFKGSGWYVTDYARPSTGNADKGESGGAAEKPGSASESKTESKAESNAESKGEGKGPSERKEKEREKEKKKPAAKEK
jgi:putative FmdB family regulatory protein